MYITYTYYTYIFLYVYIHTYSAPPGVRGAEPAAAAAALGVSLVASAVWAPHRAVAAGRWSLVGENHRKTIGKPWENGCLMEMKMWFMNIHMGYLQENHRKSMEQLKWWLNGDLMVDE